MLTWVKPSWSRKNAAVGEDTPPSVIPWAGGGRGDWGGKKKIEEEDEALNPEAKCVYVKAYMRLWYWYVIGR